VQQRESVRKHNLCVVEHYNCNKGGKTSDNLYPHRAIIIGSSSRNSQQGAVYKQRGGRLNNKGEINSLTAKSVPAGTKNSRPVGFYSRNSTESTLHHKHNNPQTLPPWWCRLPLIRRRIYVSARSDARNLFRRGRVGGWQKRII
jgi:hypothetical protein